MDKNVESTNVVRTFLKLAPFVAERIKIMFSPDEIMSKCTFVDSVSNCVLKSYTFLKSLMEENKKCPKTGLYPSKIIVNFGII